MSTAVGRLAEDTAARYLQAQGFKILARNWRTRWCEIDIIAEKAGRIIFVEVKYRRTNTWGDGLEYITAQKLQQMQFAADIWRAAHNPAKECGLAAITLSGEPPKVDAYIDDI